MATLVAAPNPQIAETIDQRLAQLQARIRNASNANIIDDIINSGLPIYQQFQLLVEASASRGYCSILIHPDSKYYLNRPLRERMADRFKQLWKMEDAAYGLRSEKEKQNARRQALQQEMPLLDERNVRKFLEDVFVTGLQGLHSICAGCMANPIGNRLQDGQREFRKTCAKTHLAGSADCILHDTVKTIDFDVLVEVLPSWNVSLPSETRAAPISRYVHAAPVQTALSRFYTGTTTYQLKAGFIPPVSSQILVGIAGYLVQHLTAETMDDELTGGPTKLLKQITDHYGKECLDAFGLSQLGFHDLRFRLVGFFRQSPFVRALASIAASQQPVISSLYVVQLVRQHRDLVELDGFFDRFPNYLILQELPRLQDLFYLPHAGNILRDSVFEPPATAIDDKVLSQLSNDVAIHHVLSINKSTTKPSNTERHSRGQYGWSLLEGNNKTARKLHTGLHVSIK